MRTHRIVIALACASLAAAPVLAKDPPAIHQFKDKDPVTIAPDKAYLLIRSNVVGKQKQDFVLVRDLTPAEVAEWKALQAKAEAKRVKQAAERLAEENQRRAQTGAKPLTELPEKDRPVAPVVPGIKHGLPNVVRVDGGRSLVKSDAERVYLIEVPAGTYLIAGQSPHGMVGGTCMCMGSVRFAAAAGRITDLGHVLAAPENGDSDVPEFAGLSGDPSIRIAPWVVAVRQPGAGIAFPPQVDAALVTPARYVPAAKFPNYFGMLVNRMPPIAGVLSYDGDKVVGVPDNKDAASAGDPAAGG